MHALLLADPAGTDMYMSYLACVSQVRERIGEPIPPATGPKHEGPGRVDETIDMLAHLI